MFLLFEFFNFIVSQAQLKVLFCFKVRKHSPISVNYLHFQILKNYCSLKRNDLISGLPELCIKERETLCLAYLMRKKSSHGVRKIHILCMDTTM